jgi:hypothetical protein
MDFTSPQFWAQWILVAIAAYVGAYAAEKGKRRAAVEDKDQILSELAKTTQKVKEIESKILGEQWRRQWVTSERRDAYVSVLTTLSIRARTISHLRELSCSSTSEEVWGE